MVQIITIIFILLIFRYMKVKLSQGEKTRVKQLHRNCKQGKHADKLKGILLLDKGHSCVGVVGILLLDNDTIRKQRNIYLNQRAASLLVYNKQG